jgi:hypothetical protein
MRENPVTLALVRTRSAIVVGIVIALGLPFVAACGRGPQAPGASSALASDQAAAVGQAPVHVPWVKMNRGQRLDYMVKTVLPKMKAEFVAFDAKRFARMDCATCHGEGVDEGTFALPNAKLPTLLEDDLFAKHRKLTPEMTQFMLTKVEPDLAALLEIPEFDPATRKGLSCYNCHGREILAGQTAPPPADHH